MNISIETLVLVAAKNKRDVFQGMWTVTSLETSQQKHYFFQSEATLLESPSDLEITKLYSFSPGGLTSEKLSNIPEHSLYLLKYALLSTVELMDAPSIKKPMFSCDQDLSSFIERLLPNFSQEEILALPDEIGFAASIDFTPTDDVGKKAAVFWFVNMNN